MTWRPGGPVPGGSANVTFDSNPYLPPPLVFSAGMDVSVDPQVVQITVISISESIALILRIPLAYFAPGQTILMHGFETNGLLARINLMAPQESPELLGFTGGGSITLDEASMVPGQPVTGSFEGRFVPLSPL